MRVISGLVVFAALSVFDQVVRLAEGGRKAVWEVREQFNGLRGVLDLLGK